MATVKESYIPIALSMVGLVLVVLGTDGIKICIAALGRPQFEDLNI